MRRLNYGLGVLVFHGFLLLPRGISRTKNSLKYKVTLWSIFLGRNLVWGNWEVLGEFIG
jgi:hypothetical protein